MKINEVVKEIVDSNNWLNGLYDYQDGDIMAIVKSEKFEKITIAKDLKDLWNWLSEDYEGVFKFKNLLFFNDYHYGCFVYDISNTKNYIEHLTIDAMSYEEFKEIVKGCLKKMKMICRICGKEIKPYRSVESFMKHLIFEHYNFFVDRVESEFYLF